MSELPVLAGVDPLRIIMVCMGNICRSPAAAVVLRAKLDEAGLRHVSVDSAGTGGWHEGDDANPRSRVVWESRGYRGEHKARQFRTEWFDERDLILVMDDDNHATLLSRAHSDEQRARVMFLRQFDPELADVPSGDTAAFEVPDPYYGGPEDFEHMLDLIERACDGLVAHIRGA